ncbi:hypothetical protein Zmor_026318 [Zophobas morio]|uniref:Uncharacterized protein n=1 Tax=Zophobas morio TaxID=2755281 RepID=A0AA38HVQ8_9CUCU|nr:hypothetical protein Zmor_026318 [Zophobas morio]
MCEITKNNFKEKFPDIKKSLQKAKFISLDLEFSALEPLQAPRLFDNNKERYAKLRKNLLNVVPVQVGITVFHFDNTTDDYFGDMYTFYVAPPAFLVIDKPFFFQASTTKFLCLHNFDFNKFAYLGIPYLNNEEERILREKLASGDLFGENCFLRSEFNDVVKTYVPIVSKWYNSSTVGNFLEIPDLKKYEQFHEIIYFMHKHLRSRFPNLWTYEKNGCFCVKKVSVEELEVFRKNCKLNEDILNDLIGFKHVFNLLVTLRKPIIGHNVLQDLMIIINNFHSPLPDSYSQFKALTHNLFPTIFDTKNVYYELRSTIPKEKLPEDTDLKSLFNYFKDGLGRHLVVNSTAIESNIDQQKVDHYHDAGWDSYCTGYIFLRMAHFKIAKNYPKHKKFVTNELIAAVMEYKNRVNVIRGASSHIRIDGEDPTSNRPPWLIVESLKNEPLDVSDLMSTLSSYGSVDIKKFSSSGNRVLVAVDNYRAARDISKVLKTHQKFQVRQYNAFRHSPLAQVVLLSAVTISGTLLLWLTHRMSKR